MVKDLLPVQNGPALKLADIPQPSFPDFYDSLVSALDHGEKIVQFFAYATEGKIKLMAVLRRQGLSVMGCDAPETYPALTLQQPMVHLFEREIAEQYGIRPQNHPWLKSVRYHANYRGTPDLFGNDYQSDIPGSYPYFDVSGEEIHQVAVGPVHAGIIEPGHFRFNCAGEKVLHLEIQLGYQHRGIEQLLVKSPAKRLPTIAENIAGDTSVGHGLSFAQAMEGLTQTTVDEKTQTIRALALELERLANHIGDLGALSGDVAFLPPAAYYGRIRGDFLNLLLLLSGNRFGKGLVRPGGVVFDCTNEKLQAIQHKCRELTPQIAHVGHLLLNSPSVLSRFENTGPVSQALAEEIGLVGVAARASGIPYDVRLTFPTGYYQQKNMAAQVETSGDVLARAKVRLLAIQQSLALIDGLTLPGGRQPWQDRGERTRAKNAFVVTLNEGWRGEISHCLLTDANGDLLRAKIKDPSFHNWQGLALALRNQEISDFPLCNKSFNLSYCGFDL